MAKGTTAGTGALEWVGPGRDFLCKLKFGTASVDLEVKTADGDAIKVEAGILADYVKAFLSPAPVMIRFNVTSHSSAVKWEILQGIEG